MTIEEHIRVAEHHLGAALAEMRRPKSLTAARMAQKRIAVVLVSILHLIRAIRKSVVV